MPSNNPYEPPASQDDHARPDADIAGSFSYFSITENASGSEAGHCQFQGTLDSPSGDVFEPNRFSGRRIQVYLYTFGAYVLHTLAFWAVICFLDAQVATELQPVFESIATTYGRFGLLGVALVYAFAPATVCLIIGVVAANKITSDQDWKLAAQIYLFLMPPTCFIDIVFGVTLFTTG